MYWLFLGMFPPTKGTALITGYDIRYDMPHIRESLGLCPQHNILFDDLTVKEHIYFFSKLKGFAQKEIDEEIVKYVKWLDLEDKVRHFTAVVRAGARVQLSNW